MAEKKLEQAPWWQPGLILFYKLSAWIAGPIVVALFLGKYLDSLFGSSPWVFLVLTATAFASSTFFIIYIYNKELKKLDEAEFNKKQADDLK
jgi:F0F1-type ATP synthase assembly protein I